MPRRDQGWLLALGVVAVTAIVVRVVHLDRLPGEWYGDISTVYEYVLSLRNGQHPPGFFVVGIGPLYPEVARPFLWSFGDNYLALKVTSACISLVGLALLFVAAREWFGRRVALVTTAIASVSAWLLVFSRLGDQQTLNPTLMLAALLCAWRTLRMPRSTVWPMAAGGLSALGLYLYGNSFVLPALVGGMLAVEARRRREVRAPFVVAAVTGALLAAPLVIVSLTGLDRLRNGHFGSRMVTGWKFFPNLIEGYGKALRAYVDRGDPGFRGGISGAAQLDRISLLAALIGVVVVLTGRQRRRGLLVVGGFLLMHLPAVLAGASEVPNAGRTLAAAPFAYLLAGVGLEWTATRVGAVWRARPANVALAAVVVLIAVVNLQQYFGDYADGLPLGNIPIAREITDFADALQPDVGVYLVGSGWAAWGMPEEKSIRYAMDRPQRLVEYQPERFDCATLAAIHAPAVVVWSSADALPSTLVGGCATALTGIVLHEVNGTPVFHSAVVDPAR